jgi:NAD(P)H-flavin reductase
MSGARPDRSCGNADAKNLYLPQIAEIINIKEETKGARAVKTFRFRLVDELAQRSFSYRAGQCAIVSVFGAGECMFALSNTPMIKEYMEVSVLRQGRVTAALHALQVGDTIGVRGPFGNGFPIENWVGKNIVFVGGGIGQAPIRSVMNTCIRRKGDFKRLTLIYGARTTADLVFKDELDQLLKSPDIDVHLGIDVAEKGWPHFVGFVPTNVLEVKPPPEGSIAVTCGPPIMIKFVIMNLEKLGFKDDQIFTTVEAKMKCGIGKCGRCNIGGVYVCKDGPVFSWKQLKALPQEY